jgi:hypothetical protein
VLMAEALPRGTHAFLKALNELETLRDELFDGRRSR